MGNREEQNRAIFDRPVHTGPNRPWSLILAVADGGTLMRTQVRVNAPSADEAIHAARMKWWFDRVLEIR